MPGRAAGYERVGAIAFAHAVARRASDSWTSCAPRAPSGRARRQRANLIEAARALGAHDPAARVAAYAGVRGNETDLRATRRLLVDTDREGYAPRCWPPTRPPFRDGVCCRAQTLSERSASRMGLARALSAQGKDDTVPRAAYRRTGRELRSHLRRPRISCTGAGCPPRWVCRGRPRRSVARAAEPARAPGIAAVVIAAGLLLPSAAGVGAARLRNRAGLVAELLNTPSKRFVDLVSPAITRWPS